MVSDILKGLLTANLAGGGAIILVLAVRGAVLHRCGARLAYQLWLAPPIAALAVFLPAPAWMSLAWRLEIPRAAQTILLIEGPAALPGPITSPATAPLAGRLDVEGLLLAAWLIGILIAALLTFLAHRRGMSRFGTLSPSGVPDILRAANHGLGPALIGILRPRLVLPADFEQRFNPTEQALILEHERRHGRCGDVCVNAILSLIGCLNWFNPLIHLAAARLRLDQELACDAAIVERFPGERRTYGQALLKSQLAGLSLPLGCTWPTAPKRLQERLTMLTFDKPARARLVAGGALIAILCLATAAAAWAAAGAAGPNRTPLPVMAAQPTRSNPPRTAQPSLASGSATLKRAARVTPTDQTITGATPTSDLSVVNKPIEGCSTDACLRDAGVREMRDGARVANEIRAGDAYAVLAAGGSAEDVVAAWKMEEFNARHERPGGMMASIIEGTSHFIVIRNGVLAVISRTAPQGAFPLPGLIIRTLPNSGGDAADDTIAARVRAASLNEERARLNAEYQDKLGIYKPEFGPMVALRERIAALDEELRYSGATIIAAPGQSATITITPTPN